MQVVPGSLGPLSKVLEDRHWMNQGRCVLGVEWAEFAVLCKGQSITGEL